MSSPMIHPDEPSSDPPPIPGHFVQSLQSQTFKQRHVADRRLGITGIDDYPDALLSTELNCITIDSQGHPEAANVKTLIPKQSWTDRFLLSRDERRISKACYVLQVTWSYNTEDLESIEQAIRNLRSKPRFSRAHLAWLLARLQLMKTGVTIHGCAIHIGHGYLATAGHCVQLPGILREIEAKPKISLRLFWGSGSLYHPERCKRFQAYQATLVAVSPEIKNVWSTAEGIRTVDDVAGLLDFAFLRIAEPVSKLGKTFRFQHFLIPSRLPETTAEHAVGLLAANGEIGTSLYYEKYVQFMVTGNKTNPQTNFTEIESALKSLNQGHIVMSLEKGHTFQGALGLS